MAHVGQKLAFRLVGLHGLVAGLLHLLKLHPGHLKISDKDREKAQQDNAAAHKDHDPPLPVQTAYRVVEGVIRHDRHQIPLGIGELGTVQMTPFPSDRQHLGVVLVRRHGGGQLFYIHIPIAAARLLHNSLDPLKIALPEGLAASDYKAAILADNMGIHKGIAFIQG